MSVGTSIKRVVSDAKVPLPDIGKKNEQRVSAVLGTGFVILLWQFFGMQLSDLVLPTPLDVAMRIISEWNLIWINLKVTLKVGIVAFVIAVLSAFVVAILLTLSEWLHDTFMPIVVGMNSVPRLTLAPLIIFYTSGLVAHYIIAIWIAFFPMLANVVQGLHGLDDEYEALLDSLGATTWQEYKWVRLPNAIPFIFDGLKLTASLALVGAIIAEFVAADTGIGVLALVGIQAHDMELVFASITVMGIIGLVVFYTIFILQDRLVYWKEAQLFPE